MKLSVREWQEDDIERIVGYFTNASPEFLLGMGVDINKVPNKEVWFEKLQEDFKKDNREKDRYYIIWQVDGKSVGHSNINKIIFGKESYMHLHIWEEEMRYKGMGIRFLKKTIPYYFNNFQLQELFCEPYALNPAVNKTLIKVGFEFIKQYETTPGWINLYQKVNRYLMTKERFDEKIGSETS